MTFTNEYLRNYLEEHKNELFADLAYIVSFPSIKSAPEEGAPFGKPSAVCLEAAAGLYRKYGFEAEVFADLGYALAYYGKKPAGDDKFMGVMCHTDVVPVTPEDWTLTEPFKMIDTGENVVGRGVSDNKNAVIGVLYILRAMKDCGYTPAHTITVFLGSNEEAGMVDIRNFKKSQNPLPKVCVVPDGAFPVSFGERGSFHADVKSKNNLCDILAIQGGSAYNVVLGKFTCTLKALPGLETFIKANPVEWLEYKVKDDTIEIEASGISAHGGRPYRGESALARFMAYFAKFDGFCETDAQIIRESAAMLSDCYGINYGIDSDDADMGKLTAANGKVYIEDGKLVFTLDIRFGPSVDKDKCKETLNANVESRGFTLKTTKGGTSFKIDPANPLAVAFIESYRRYSGKPDATYFYMSGGTYSKVMQPEVVSFSTGVTCSGYVARLGLPAGHGNCHEADETLGKAELINGLCILGGIITDLDKAY